MVEPLAGPVALPSDQWRCGVTDLVAQGWDFPEFLTAVDWPQAAQIEVTCALRRLGGGSAEVLLVTTRVPRSEPVLDSLAMVLPGLGWHERETQEMFGVRFTGHPDPAPLLLDGTGQWPLRRTRALPARVAQTWPGHADPADHPPAGQPPARRRGPAAVPGNPPEWADQVPGGPR